MMVRNLAIKYFLIKVCTPFVCFKTQCYHPLERLQYGVQHNFYIHWETKNFCVTHLFALFPWSRTEAVTSPRYIYALDQPKEPRK